MKQIKRIIQSYITLLKIKATKKAVQLLSDIVAGIIAVLLILMCLFFLGIALALFVSDLLDSYFVGFLLTGIFCVVLFVFFQLFKPQINKKFKRIFTKMITRTEDE